MQPNGYRPAEIFRNAWVGIIGTATLGGALCATLSLLPWWAIFFIVSVPIGAVVGLVIGLTLGLALASALTITSPTCNPRRVPRVLGVGFACVAVAINGPVSIAGAIDSRSNFASSSASTQLHSTSDPSRDATWIAVALASTALTALIAYALGSAAGHYHLRRIGPRRDNPAPASTPRSR